jgi:hypothetical protein
LTRRVRLLREGSVGRDSELLGTNGKLGGVSWQGAVDVPANAPASQVCFQVRIPVKIEDREGVHLGLGGKADNGSHGAFREGSSEYFFLVTVGFETAYAEA